MIYKFLLILYCVLLSTIIGFSQEKYNISTDSIIIFDGTEDFLSLAQHFTFFEDQKKLSIEEVGDPSLQNKFIKPDANIPFKVGQTYWAKLRMLNKYKASEFTERYYLFTHEYKYKPVEVFLKMPRGQGYKKEVISQVEIAKQGRTPEATFWGRTHRRCQLPITTTDTLTYYFKFTFNLESLPKELYVELVPLQTFKDAATTNSFETRSYIILVYLGLLLMMLLYSIGLYVMMRESAFIYYGFFCFSTMVFHATSYDIIDTIIINLAPSLFKFEYLSYIFAHLAIFSFSFFITVFLNLKKDLPRWNKIFRNIGIVIIVLALLEIIYFQPKSPFLWKIEHTKRLHYLLIPIIIVTFIFLIPAWKLKTKKKLFLILGILSILIGLIIIVSSTLLGKRINVYSYMIFLVFSAIEVIFFALGLAYRIKENELEKQQTIIQLQKVENEKRINELEKQKLEEINELKTNFYTNITHEFRTPLTVIEGLARELKGNKEDKGIILSNSKQLLNLVNRLLSLSKLESGAVSPTMIQSNVVAYISYITESFRTLAEFKNIEIIFTAKVKNLMMDFDEEILLHIVSNLISNAIKFTDIKGVVEVLVTKKDTSLLLTVKDTGIGIPSQKIERIFDRFYQVEDSSIRRAEGTGIGLSLVKELIEILNGEITVESKEGDGSSFLCTFPISNNAPLNDAKFTDKEVFNIAKNELESLAQGNKPLILIVEDNKDITYYIIKCLKENYQIKTAINGQEGLNKAFEEIPDFIISDIMMPEMDGFELCQKLKQDKRTSHIPLLLLTAKIDDEARLEGLSKGADAYLSKPFKKEELEIRIKKMLELRQKLLKHYSDNENAQLKKIRTIEDEFLVELREIILNNLDNKAFDTPFFVRKSGMSSSSLHRKLTALTGKSANKFINSVRLQKAKELLDERNLSISQIALEVGYNDLSYFSASFKKEFGYPPSKYV